jgi:predicted DNA-binding transcriptional regulator AlpA
VVAHQPPPTDTGYFSNMTVVDDAGLPPQADSHDRLIDGPEADKILGTSRSRRYARQKADPTFPQPVKDGRVARYSFLECQSYVRNLLASRGGA